MKHLLIISFVMLGFASFGQEPNCAAMREAISKSHTLMKKEGRKVEVSESCSTITVEFWDKISVYDLNNDDGIKNVLREIIGMLIEEDAIPALKEAGLKRIEVKILGEAKASGYFDLETDRIIVGRWEKGEAAEKLKDQIGGLFGEDINSGSGVVGGSLSNRGFLAAPIPNDSSQATGTVVVEVCVDSNGNIMSAEFTHRGSTTNNVELVGIAVSNAKKWRFTKSDIEIQCGTITYNFRFR